MNTSREWSKKLCVLALAAIVFASASIARGNGGAQAKSDSAAGTRLHLEITGGDPAGPVEGASVYVRYLVKHRMAKDENVEMNLKTSHDGTVMVPFRAARRSDGANCGRALEAVRTEISDDRRRADDQDPSRKTAEVVLIPANCFSFL